MMQRNTFERITPDHLNLTNSAEHNTLNLHKARYHFAARHLRPGKVLDIACGVGYGAYELLLHRGDDISLIIAVDISASALEYARKRYYNEKILFIQEDAHIYYSRLRFNTIISLETIEHLPDPEKFVQRLWSMLSDKGVLIISVPVTLSTDVNPYHLNDFTINSFRNFFKQSDMIEEDALLQKQPYRFVDVMQRKGNRYSEIRKNLAAYYLSHPISFIKRMYSIMTDGFCNKYLTLAIRKQAVSGETLSGNK